MVLVVVVVYVVVYVVVVVVIYMMVYMVVYIKPYMVIYMITLQQAAVARHPHYTSSACSVCACIATKPHNSLLHFNSV